MLSHLLKLIWKKKTSNFLLTLEIFFSFLVLFAVCSLATYFVQNYRNASGIQSENVWVLFVVFNTDTTANADIIRQQLKTYPQVESFSFCSSNVPYSFSSMNSGIRYNNTEVMSEVMHVDFNYHQSLGLTLAEGRWFTPDDTTGGLTHPIVITRALQKALFGNEPAIGKTWDIQDEDNRVTGNYKVVGVIEDFKHKNDFQERDNVFFQPSSERTPVIVMRMRPDADATFEAKITREILQMGKNWSAEIQRMKEMKREQNKFVWIPMLIAVGVCTFLVINVAMGLFGVLFQNISRRRGEIGVRRAMGADKRVIQGQFLTETLLLTSLGVGLGLFFAIQFPLLAVFDVPADIYGTGILIAALIIYILTLLCAWYPARQAAQIFPAEALRAE